MPKSDTCNSVGFEFPVNNLPATVEEFDQMAQREGACLDAAIGQYIAHTHLTKVRSILCEKAEELTGIEREKEEEDGKVTYSESEKKYLDRVEAELQSEGRSMYEGDLYAKLVEAASSVEVDLTKQTRSGGSTKVAQKWLDMAKDVIAQGKAEAFAEKFGLTLTGEEEDDLKTIGSKLKEETLRIQRQAQADLMAL